MLDAAIRAVYLRGIVLRLHVTTLLAAPLVALWFVRVPRVLGAAEPEHASWWLGVAGCVAWLLSLVFREWVHAWLLVSRGAALSAITLMPFGGIVRATREPRGSRLQRCLLASSGAVASLVIGALLLSTSRLVTMHGSSSVAAGMHMLGWVNAALGAFALVPALPMDGGKVVRVLLEPVKGRAIATRTAADLGKVVAVICGSWALLTFDLLLLLIGVAIHAGAQGMQRHAYVAELTRGICASALMRGPLPFVSRGASVHDVVRRMLQTRRAAVLLKPEDACVAGAERLQVASLTLERVRAIAPLQHRYTRASDVARMLPVLPPHADIGEALRVMGEHDVGELPIGEHGAIVGTILREDILRELQLQELDCALAGARGGVRVVRHALRPSPSRSGH